MQQLLDHIEKEFPSYFKQVNANIRAKTKDWDSLFEDKNEFYRTLLLVIQSFLKDGKKILFIQLPTDKLGRNKTDQENNRKNLQEYIVDILYLSTKCGWEPTLRCPCLANSYVGDFYYSDRHVWEIATSNDGQRRPSNASKKLNLKTEETRRIFENGRKNSVKLQNVCSASKKDTCKSIEESEKFKRYIDQINNYRKLPAIAGFEKSLLVGKGQTWSRHPIANQYLYSPIKFVTDYDGERDKSYDILVFLWDKKYRNYEMEIHNSIVNGRVKKVIVIGERIFPDFKNRDDITIYPFTYRELFSYFYSTGALGNSMFPNIVFKELPYHELNSCIASLGRRVPNVLEEFERKRIIRYILYPYLTIESKALPIGNLAINNLRDFLWENFNVLTTDEIDSLVGWVSELNLSIKTPKAREYSEIKNKNRYSQLFDIRPYASYKNKLKTTKTKNDTTQIYVIDAIFNGNWCVEVIETLLKKGCLGTYYILSYFKLPSLRQFFEEELEIYRSSLRKSLFGVSMSGINAEDSSESNNLLDFYDDSIDELSSLFLHKETNHLKIYNCLFEGDDRPVSLYGDVIYMDRILSIDEIFSNSDEYLPCEITYYSIPSIFPQIMEVYFNFPNGQNVDYYSNFWKQKMQELFKNKYAGNLQSMLSDFRFLKKETLGLISKGKYDSMFPNQIGKIVDNLRKIGAITAEEQHYIMAANNVVGKHSSTAKELKESLMRFKLTGKPDDFLNKLLDNANVRGVKGYTADYLIKESLNAGTITEITLSN
jgi:hypothetical protein